MNELGKTKLQDPEKAWAEYWGTTCPDCGPRDFNYMLTQAIDHHERIAILEEQNRALEAALTQIADHHTQPPWAEYARIAREALK